MPEDERYDEVAAEYQYRMLEILNATLEKFGVASDTRKDICGEFAFDFGMLHDQGELRVGGVNYCPKVHFNGEATLEPTDTFEFHEYAFGNAADLFESRD